ncbi:hypothetical protein [Pandoraea sputorum]|uniref:Uncharacterized protein n=1 Tax=Pandoraea sputorum TaxID=93222 RepID=A0A5E5BHX3_9BURK|nr:hypothetical protein [Pandoraea sputorum]VVE85811.1 hypothetical protein PSP31121_05442 [Pandoraea sputorum]
MDHLSVNTFVRAFSAAAGPETALNLGKAAGDYDNTTCTKIAKGVVGVLTLGIGYGIIWLIEHFGNVSPKIDEFRQAASDLYRELECEHKRIQGGEVHAVSIKAGSKTVTFCETASGVEITDGTRLGLLRGATLASVKTKLFKDFADNAAAYGRFHRPVEAVGIRNWEQMNGAGINCSVIHTGDVKLQTMKVKAAVHAQNVTSLTLCPRQPALPDESLVKQFSLSKVRSLRILSVDMNYSFFLTRSQYGELERIVTSNPDLTKVQLHLGSSARTRHAAAPFFPAPNGIELPLLALTTLNKLEELSIDLSHMGNYPERGNIFSILGEAFKRPAFGWIKNLTLSLRCSALSDSDLNALLSGVTKMKKLKIFTLDLRGNGSEKITSSGFAGAFSLIKKMEMLESLELLIPLEEEVNFKQLSAALRSLKYMKKIIVKCGVSSTPYHDEFRAALKEMEGRGVRVTAG